MTTISATKPVKQPWQHGWEIPVNVTETQHDGMDGAYTAWEYDRVVTPDLSEASIMAAVAEQFDGDPAVLAQALAE